MFSFGDHMTAVRSRVNVFHLSFVISLFCFVCVGLSRSNFTALSPSPPQLMMYVQKVIANRKVQEQQLALARQGILMNQLALQNGIAGGMSQMELLGLYQQLGALQGLPTSQIGKNPGPSKGL